MNLLSMYRYFTLLVGLGRNWGEGLIASKPLVGRDRGHLVRRCAVGHPAPVRGTWHHGPFIQARAICTDRCSTDRFSDSKHWSLVWFMTGNRTPGLLHEIAMSFGAASVRRSIRSASLAGPISEHAKQSHNVA